MGDLVVRYLHFIGILVLFASVVVQHMLLAPTVTKTQLRRLQIVDRLVGGSAAVALIAGLGLWFYVGKPAEVYSSNWIFHLKFTLFIVAALASVYPTIKFIQASRLDGDAVTMPKGVIMVVRLELLILLILPLLAVLMAAGVGLS